MITETTAPPKSSRAALAALARALKIPDRQCRTDGNGVALIVGARGRVQMSDDGLLVVVGPTASPSLALQLCQSGLLADVPDQFLMTRLPDEAEVRIMRDLLGLNRDGLSRAKSPEGSS
jgi:hypothetical protein